VPRSLRESASSTAGRNISVVIPVRSIQPLNCPIALTAALIEDGA
jgi:hypothetical protein